MRIAWRALWQSISPRLRRRVAPLLGLMLAGAFAELVTIGAVIPFLAALSGTENSSAIPLVTPLLELLGADDANGLYVAMGFFAIAAVVAIGVRLLLLWASQKFVYGVSYELSVSLYSNTLHEPYPFHLRRNSSEIIAGINKVQLVTNEFLMPVIQASIAFVIAAFILAGLIAVDPVVALAAAASLALIYLIVMVATRTRLRRNSGVIARAQSKRIQAMQEGLGGIRDVLLGQSQPVFVETFAKAEAGFRDSRVRVGFIAGAPRFVVEGAGMVMIAILAVTVTQRSGGVSDAIPILGAIALGSQRLIPLIQIVYSGWARAVGNRQNLDDLVQLLEREGESTKQRDEKIVAMPFMHEIALHNVSFAYTDDRGPALRDLSLTIPKGARVGIAGRTGSGKSTLMDILIGLLQPTSGTISVDGVPLTSENMAAWQANIAHVPQFIFLADATIAENIAFGVFAADVDMARVRRAAARAEMTEVIADLPQRYETRIGERGVQLSGGQRQRLGIARGLYRGGSVLVFDEATSALDDETEAAVMSAIERLGKEFTILVIAHRLSTLEGCDMTIRLEQRLVGSTNALRASARTEPPRT